MIKANNETGENFVPTAGQTWAVVMWINGNTQVPIVRLWFQNIRLEQYLNWLAFSSTGERINEYNKQL